MGHSRRLLVLVIIALPALACRAALRLVSDAVPAPTAAVTTMPSSGGLAASCPLEMGSVLRAANTQSLSFSMFPTVDTGSDIYVPLVTYAVSGDDLSSPVLDKVPQSLVRYQNDFGTQQSAWKLFTELIPRDWRSMISQFQIMTDGPGGVLSAVEQTRDDPKSWVLETDIADIPDAKNLTFTLLHEFGHLLTLGPSQVPPNLQVFTHPDSMRVRNRALATCPDYFPGEGCSLPTSYVNVYFSRFWKGIYDEWSAIDQIGNDGRREGKLDSFYRKYRQQFVDSYAVTSPVEDIAETWAFFVLSPRPSGTSVENQKLQFFYQYPELVTLRAQILSGLCAAKP